MIKTFTFIANGMTIKIKADSKLKAMRVANRQFTLEQGAWFENETDGFRWVAGNFFD